MGKILVIAEHRDGKLSDGTKELCKVAKEMAEMSGNTAAAAVFSADDAIAKEVSKYIPEVLSGVDAKLAQYTADGYSQAAKSVIEAGDVAGVVISHGYDGVDFAAQVAMSIGAGIVSGINKVEFSDGKFVFTRNIYNGKLQEQRSVKTDKFVVTVEKGAWDKEAAGSEGTITSVDVAVGDVRTTVKEVIETTKGAVDISQAKLIVAGGRGTKDAEKYQATVVALAQKLKGEYGASRAVVDAGWTDHARQIGQSGKTVAPDLYIGLGLSGAIQHVAGMKGAKCIVAVNKDPEAPIFNIATYGIVGDLFEVVPAMIEALDS
ncbi:MAG: electron transfer flavoprotein subunit alpha/FixB family protein [Spirochaetes bacterium]|nr:electron transfer flavoprotein subunit alpha/FixB family protein [Spirochaetota bacterium]